MKRLLIPALLLLAACGRQPTVQEPPAPAPQASFYTDPPQVGYTPMIQVYDSLNDNSVHQPDSRVDIMIFTAPNGCQWLIYQGYEAGAMVEYKGPDHQQICVPRDE